MFSKISEQICWSEKLPASVNFFHVRPWQLFGHNMMLFNPELETIAFRKLHPNPEFRSFALAFFWGCTEIPSSYGNVTMGLGEATRLWSGWFEHSPFQKAETSNLPKLVNLTNETHSDSFHFTRTAIENKKSWTNTTCIQKRKNYPGEKHVKALLLPSTFGLPRWYQKHSKTFKRTWILWILESLLLFERNYLFQSLRLAPHLFTLISIPDFVVTFGLNQHPLPADFFLFQDIAAAQHRKECRQTVC